MKTNQKTAAQVLADHDGGDLIIKGLYMSGKVTEISVRDTKSAGGGRRAAHVARQVIMKPNKTDVFTVNEFLPDTMKPDDWLPSAKMGELVAVYVEGSDLQAGTLTVTRGVVVKVS